MTRDALVLALTVWHEVGAANGDRIEHGAVIPPELFSSIRALDLTVVTQPSFVRERGDRYFTDVDEVDRPHLWRCASLLDAGISTALGTDAPYGDPDPWRAIRTATDRRTSGGAVLGKSERVTASTALGLFLDRTQGRTSPLAIRVGAPADLCLLDRPLTDQLRALTADAVAATIVQGRIVWSASGRFEH